MPGERYRLKTPTLAVLWQDSHRLPMTIPQGGIVRVIGPTYEDRQLVDVEWEGKKLLMFAVDLRGRGDWLTRVRFRDRELAHYQPPPGVLPRYN
jgi:hypothetical protein